MSKTKLDFIKNDYRCQKVRRGRNNRFGRNIRIKYRGNIAEISFYDGSYIDIVGSDETIEIAKFQERLYFKGSDEGYHLSANRNSLDSLNRRIMNITTDILKGFEGYYNLQFDSELGLFYIDLKEGI